MTDYHRAQGRESKEQLLDVIDRIKGNFQTHIGRNDKRVKDLAKARGKVQKLEGLLEMGDLFGSVDEKKVRKQLKPLQTKVGKLEAELAAVRDNAIYEQAFEWRFEFPAVLGGDGEYLGFDVVVGNPPYGVNLDVESITYYRNKFSTILGQAEVYYLFIEFCINKIIKNHGALTFIVPNAWMSNKYAKEIRKLLLENDLRELVNLNQQLVFDEAQVETSIISVGPNYNRNNIWVGQSLDKLYEIDKRIWCKDERYIIHFSPNKLETDLLLKVIESGEPASSILDISNGCKPYQAGYGKNINGDPLSVSDVRARIYHRDKKTKGSRVEVKGRNIGRYSIEYPEKYILWGSWLMSPKDGKYFENPRILVRQITGERLTCTLDTSDAIADQSLYVGIELLPFNNLLKAYLAILNSSLIGFFFRKFYSEEDDLFPKIKVNELKRLPIAKVSAPTGGVIDSLVTNILSLKSTDPTADTSALEAEIDVLVYKLYGLTHAEVLVVDPEFGLSEGEYAAVEVG